MPSTEKVPEVRWLLAPDALVDHFKIIRPLGKGGMAEVYLCRDTKLGRKVALKVIRPDVLGSPDAVERFLFEARATARFNHPHIVTIYAVGEKEGRPYVALEYLEGQTLRERIEGERLAVAEAIRNCLAVAEALREAHQHNLLHRDLKPENVMLGRDGRLRVLDFGLARVVRAVDVDNPDRLRSVLSTVSDRTGEQSLLEADFESQHQKLIGTPAYMAPEQWNQGEVTAAADIWALGVMLFELLTGRRPYDDHSAVKLALEICGDAPAPRIEGQHKVPAEIGELVDRCLAKKPGQRPTASEVVQKLQRYLTQDRESLSTEESPFRGLLPFGEQHRHFFFGRDSEVSAFIERLRSEPLLPVLGPSGAGKSSFVQAGVIPRLRERGPLVVIQLRPGRDPFGTLAGRIVAARHQASKPISTNSPFGFGNDLDVLDELHDDEARSESERLGQQLMASPHLLNIALTRLGEKRHSQIVLFVDQLEELYALVDDEHVRQKFMQAVCTAADDPALPVRVVFTLREEFLSRLAEGTGVREALTQMTVLRSPGREALREILTRPLEAVGYRYQDDPLVDQMVGEVQGEISCLPLLQFAGQVLWEGRDREQRILKRSVYESMGGVAGALAQHADGVLSQLTSDELDLARSMLLRLVTAEGTRKVQDHKHLVENLDVRAGEVLKRLTASRLVTTKQSESGAEGELELAHESLIASWSRLRRWIEESKEELVFLHEVSQAAELWERRGRREAELWRGDALRDAERAAEHCTSALSARIKKFLDASKGIEQRSVWLKRVALVAIVALLASVAGVFVWKEREASGQRDLARAAESQVRGSEREARSNLSAALAQKAAKAGTVYEALLYAAGALAQEEHPLARGVLLDQMTRPRPKIRWQSSKGIVCQALAHDQVRERLACAGSLDGLVVWDLTSGRVISPPDNAGDKATAVVLSADGSLLLTAHESGTIAVRDAASLDVLRRLDTATGSSGLLRLSADGALLAFGVPTGPVAVYRVDTGAELVRRSFDCATVSDLQLAHDRTRLAVGCNDGRVLVWDLSATNAPLSARVHPSEVVALAFSPDDRWLVSAGLDGDLVRLESTSVAEQARLAAKYSAAVSWIEFLADGRSLAAAGLDGKVRFLDSERLTEIRPPIDHGAAIHVALLSADQRSLYTNGLDGDLIAWTLPAGAEQARISGYGWGQHFLERSADGIHFLELAAANAVRVRRWSDGAQVAKLGGSASYVSMAFDRDRNQVVALGVVQQPAGLRNVIHVWTFAPGAPMPAREYRDPIELGWIAPAWYQDRVVRRNDRGDVCLFEIESGKCELIEAQERAQRMRLDLATHQQVLAFTDRDNNVVLWDLRQRRRLAAVSTSASNLAFTDFSPDGRLLAAAGYNGALFVIDVVRRKLAHALTGHQGMVRRVDFSPVAPLLASGSYDRSVRIWELASGRELERWTYGDMVWRVLFSPDGTSLATAGMDGTVRLWDLPAHFGSSSVTGFTTNLLALAFSSDGSALCGLDLEGHLICRDLALQTQRQVRALPVGGYKLLGLSKYGAKILVESKADHELLAVDAATGQHTSLLPASDTDRDFARSSRDQESVIVCEAGQTLRAISRRESIVKAVQTEESLSTGHRSCDFLAFSADDRRLAMSIDWSGVSVWDLEAGASIARFPTGGCALYAVEISPDGQRVAAAGCGKEILVWNVATRTRERSLLGHQGWIVALAISPDGRLLASADLEQSLRVWDLATGREVARLAGVGCLRGQQCVEFSPDGNWLAAIYQDRSVRLFDLRTLSVSADQVIRQVSAESSLTLDGVDVVPDPERLRTHFEFVEKPGAPPSSVVAQ